MLRSGKFSVRLVFANAWLSQTMCMVYDFDVDNGVWWCGEAKIYVLMSFSDIKFFSPLRKS